MCPVIRLGAYGLVLVVFFLAAFGLGRLGEPAAPAPSHDAAEHAITGGAS